MHINKIKNELIKPKESKFKGNIYHYSQVNSTAPADVEKLLDLLSI